MNDVMLHDGNVTAYMYPFEVEAGKRIIHYGNVMTCSEKFKKWMIEQGVDFSTLPKYIEDYCEVDISHETIHAIIFLLEGVDACHAFDNIATSDSFNRDLVGWK